jgi:hypothetical protein
MDAAQGAGQFVHRGTRRSRPMDRKSLRVDVEGEVTFADVGVHREDPPLHAIGPGCQVGQRDTELPRIGAIDLRVTVAHRLALDIEYPDRAERRLEALAEP